MRNYVGTAAIMIMALAGTVAYAADKMPNDADYSKIELEMKLNVSADDAWKKFWPSFCQVHINLGRPCKIVKGNGTDIGSDRDPSGSGGIHEVMIAKSKYSYTYTQTGPNPLYHHSLFEVVPEGPNKSKFVRKWFWERKGTLEADTASLPDRMKIFTTTFIEQAKLAESAKP